MMGLVSYIINLSRAGQLGKRRGSCELRQVQVEPSDTKADLMLLPLIWKEDVNKGSSRAN